MGRCVWPLYHGAFRQRRRRPMSHLLHNVNLEPVPSRRDAQRPGAHGKEEMSVNVTRRAAAYAEKALVKVSTQDARPLRALSFRYFRDIVDSFAMAAFC